MNSPTIIVQGKRFGNSLKTLDNFINNVQGGWITKTEKTSGTQIRVYCTTRQEMLSVMKMTIEEIFNKYVDTNRIKLI